MQQLKIIFDKLPGSYDHFRTLARAESWTGREGFKEFAHNEFNAKLYVRDDHFHSIKFKDVKDYNKFICGFQNSENLILL